MYNSRELSCEKKYGVSKDQSFCRCLKEQESVKSISITKREMMTKYQLVCEDVHHRSNYLLRPLYRPVPLSLDFSDRITY